MSLNHLRRDMVGALERAGLFRKEAEAMVNTWQDTWFTEPGVRVLYILPGEWTDGTLPIRIDPQPTELTRVMVGRSELISPEQEQEICECVRTLLKEGHGTVPQILSQLKSIGMGRFTIPALAHAKDTSKDPAFQKAADILRSNFNMSSYSAFFPQTSTGRSHSNGG